MSTTFPGRQIGRVGGLDQANTRHFANKTLNFLEINSHSEERTRPLPRWSHTRVATPDSRGRNDLRYNLVRSAWPRQRAQHELPPSSSHCAQVRRRPLPPLGPPSGRAKGPNTRHAGPSAVPPAGTGRASSCCNSPTQI
jgi:hypothetical protein